MSVGRAAPRIELLERRTLLAASIVELDPTVVNISRKPGQQSEGTIAIDPANPSRLFAASNEAGMSLFGAVSTDGGLTWSGRSFATGSDDNLPRACCDPFGNFDASGNLFFTYLNTVNRRINVALSTDGGSSFAPLAEFKQDGDQPTVVTGPDGRGGRAVWVAFQVEDGGAIAYRAPVPGQGQVGRFRSQRVTGGGGQNVGDLAVGPGGQVLVAYQKPGATAEGTTAIVTRLDPDGLGQRRFQGEVFVVNSNVGDFDRIPAQQRRSIDASVSLAYDTSGGPFTGRVYMAYTDESPDESHNTDVLLRYSDNDGGFWSPPLRVNDDATQSSQFFPRVAVDPATGNVGLAWHDCRNDTGVPDAGHGVGGSDTFANNEAQFYVAVGSPKPEGVDVSPNLQVTGGFSNTAPSANSNDYGDYIGLAFLGGNLQPVWADNSNVTGDNPDGRHNALDLHTSHMTVVTTPPPATGVPTATIQARARAGRRGRFQFKLTYAGNVDPATIDGSDVLVTGPNGFANTATLRRLRRRDGAAVATYRIVTPLGPRGAGRGTYTISLQPDQVKDVDGDAAAARPFFGTFVV